MEKKNNCTSLPDQQRAVKQQRRPFSKNDIIEGEDRPALLCATAELAYQNERYLALASFCSCFVCCRLISQHLKGCQDSMLTLEEKQSVGSLKAGSCYIVTSQLPTSTIHSKFLLLFLLYLEAGQGEIFMKHTVYSETWISVLSMKGMKQETVLSSQSSLSFYR